MLSKITLGGIQARLAFLAHPAIFWICAAVNVIPLWVGPAFPSIDGPAHVALTYAWLHLADPAMPQYADFFQSGTLFAPNMAVYALLWPLMQLFDPFTAEKIVLSIYAMALPAAMRFTLCHYGREARALALAAIPLTWPYVLYHGFYSFLLASPLFLVAFGTWLRLRDRMTARSGLILALLSLLCWWAHLSAALLLLGMAAAAGLCEWLMRKRNFQSLVKSGLPFVPAALLILIYALNAPGDGTPHQPLAFPDTLHRLSRLIEGDAYKAFGPGTSSFAVAVTVLSGLLLAAALAEVALAGDGVLAAFLFLFAVYLFLPSYVQVRWIPERMGYYLILFSLVAAGSRAAEALKRRQASIAVMLAGLAIPLILFNLDIRVKAHTGIGRVQARYLDAARAVPRGATVLSLRVLGKGVYGGEWVGANLLIQGGGRIAVLRDAVDVKLLQAKTRVVPVWFKPDRDAYRTWGSDTDFIRKIPAADLSAYERTAGRPVDVVMLWGKAGRADLSSITGQLARHRYRAMPCDRDGWLTLYFAPGIKPSAASCQSRP